MRGGAWWWVLRVGAAVLDGQLVGVDPLQQAGRVGQDLHLIQAGSRTTCQTKEGFNKKQNDM